MARILLARECGLLVPELEAGRGRGAQGRGRGHGGRGGGGGQQEAVEHGGALAGERRLGGGHGETGGEARARSPLNRQSDEVTRKPDHLQCHQGSLSY